MRRRRVNNSISLTTAVLVEVATMVGIIAIAQPTWTRNLVEQLNSPTAPASTVAELESSPALPTDLPVERVGHLVLPPPPHEPWQAAAWNNNY